MSWRSVLTGGQRKNTLASYAAGRNNNFDFIRWLAATMVVFSHEYAIIGGSGTEPLAQLSAGFATFGTLGVDIFFVVSGLLVTQSLIERKDVDFFVASRALRILPALFVVVALSAWVLGPMLTGLPLGAYLQSPAAWTYVPRNLTLIDLQWGLPGVFLHNPGGAAVNGSLWTLRPEVQIYGFLLLLGIVATAGGAALSRYRAAVVAAGMSAAIAWGWATHGDLAGRGLEPTSLSRLAPYFGLGALLYIARRAVPITPLVAAAAWAVAIATQHIAFRSRVRHGGCIDDCVARPRASWAVEAMGTFRRSFLRPLYLRVSRSADAGCAFPGVGDA